MTAALALLLQMSLGTGLAPAQELVAPPPAAAQMSLGTGSTPAQQPVAPPPAAAQMSLGTGSTPAQEPAAPPPAAAQMSLGTGSTPAQQPAAPPETVAVPAQEPVAAPPAPGPTPAAPGIGPAPVAHVAYEPRAEPEGARSPPRRFVFAFLPSLTMGISPLPSANVALFAGGRLPGSAWALGYQLTVSSGLAERYYAGLFTHRHHITAMRGFAKGGRGFASVGGGAAFMVTAPIVEAEGRVGLRFGSKRYGVLAAQVRLGWNIGRREQAPMPQFGLVVGFAFL